MKKFYTYAAFIFLSQQVCSQTGNVGIGTLSPAFKLSLSGANGSTTDGPHIAVYTALDNFPLFQNLNYSHDNIVLSFDAYWNGVWRSSSANSNFQIEKVTDKLSIKYSTSNVPGSPVSWQPGIILGNTGNVGIGSFSPTQKLEVAGTVKAFNFNGDGSSLANVVNTTTAQAVDGVKTFSANLIENAGIVVDATGNNAGSVKTGGIQLGGTLSGEGIASKRTTGGNQNGLDFYTNGSARMSINTAGQVLIGTGTSSGVVSIYSPSPTTIPAISTNGSYYSDEGLNTPGPVYAGSVTATGTVKQQTHSYSGTVGIGSTSVFVWTHSLGYSPILMLGLEKTSGGSYSGTAYYVNNDANTTTFYVNNPDGLYKFGFNLHWIVVN